MNPLAVVLIIVGIVLMVIGFRGHQDNLISAISGSKFGETTLR